MATKRRQRPIVVKVKSRHIRDGEPGHCFRCAVAMALQVATGDTEANVYEDDYKTMLHVHSRHIVAPVDVSIFVNNYDHLPREGGRVVRSDWREDGCEPFDFELPPFSSPEWKERCYGCEELFQAAELDDEGNCEDCRD